MLPGGSSDRNWAVAGGKTPGADGLPTKFYSQFGELLASKLTALISDFTC